MLGVPLRVCSYVIKTDTGLAPNPFWGWCTLAVCTPNHQRADLHRGDWIVGTSTKERGSRLIYVMELEEEPLALDEYFRDDRFEQKKPQLQPAHQQRERACGDNFYHMVSGSLRHTGATDKHADRNSQTKDTKGNRVFVGRNFWYFGDRAPLLPRRAWVDKLRQSQGIKYVYLNGSRDASRWTEQELLEFRGWLLSAYPQSGKLGEPRDFAVAFGPQSAAFGRHC